MDLSRRRILRASAAAAAACLAPAFLRAGSQRPRMDYGCACGEVSASGATLWARASGPVRMQVELSRDADFTRVQTFTGLPGLEANDFNVKARLQNLAADTLWHYRITCESLVHPGVRGEAVSGQFRTAANAAARDIRFCWAGDTAGQGYGIDPAYGGMLTYRAMAAKKPDFFVHSGDQVYVDNPLPESIDIGAGRSWRNRLLLADGRPAKAKVAETLQEFRQNYYYNFLDAHVRAFHAQVPVYTQWDDHEVTNNWYPGEMLLDDDRYRVKEASVLAARARRAMYECTPIGTQVGTPHTAQKIYRKISRGPLLDLFVLDLRSYRGPNSANRQAERSPATAFMGDGQLQWLQRALKASRATWKLICSDMPLGLIVRDGGNAENGANGDGPPLGRELEIAELLQFIARENIANTHFLTADVHYCASHYYHPRRAQFKDFKPFWEFVSGPLHAGTFGPNQLDNTFGPSVVFKGIPDDMPANRSPAAGYQFFGMIDIDAASAAMTVGHYDRSGARLWEKTLQPEAA